MRQTILSVSALLAGMALIFLATGMLGTLLPLRMGMVAFSIFSVGMVMSAYFVGLVSGTFLGRHLIAAVGHIRTFAALASVVSASTLVHPFLVAPVPWGVLRFTQGVCLAGIFMCTESWLNERATNEIRGRILSLYMTTVYLALGSGQLLLTLADPSGFGLFVIASVLFSVALVPVAVTRVPVPEPIEPTRFGLKELYAISPMGVWGAFASGLITGAFYGLGPYFAQQVGLGVGGTARFMAAAILGGLLLQWPIGRMSDHFDRRTVFGGAAIGVTVTSIGLLAAAGRDEAVLMAVAAVFGGTLFTLYPLSVAHANDRIDRADLVAASGGLLFVYGVGASIGPLAASGLMSVLGLLGLFAFSGGVGLLTAVFALWRMRQRAAPAAEQQGAFRAVPQTTSLASELDPRGEIAQPSFDFSGESAA